MVAIIQEDKNRGGRPSLDATEGVKDRIVEIVRGSIVCYPGQIGRLYGQKYRNGKPLSWSVVRKYLDQLKSEGRILETVLHKGLKRTTTQLRVSEQLGQVIESPLV